jgi:hypothetical protein
MPIGKTAAAQSLGFLMGVITSYGNEISDDTRLAHRQLQHFIEQDTETKSDNPLHYVKGGYTYMPDGFVMGIPKPIVGNRIVWEDYANDRLVISEVLQVLDRQIVVRYEWIKELPIDNGNVRGVLK